MHEKTIKMQIEDRQAKRINDCVKNRINFISGTVTPCQSNKYKNESFTIDDVETLHIGIKYLFDCYDNKVKLSIQPKFMGSRLNMYLFRENHLEKSYCVTRNGFMCYLPRDKLAPLYEKMHNKLKDFMQINKISLIILDGELLPWSALGKKLIDNEFIPVDKGLATEINFMEKYNFDQQLEKALQQFKSSNKSETKDVSSELGSESELESELELVHDVVHVIEHVIEHVIDTKTTTNTCEKRNANKIKKENKNKNKESEWISGIKEIQNTTITKSLYETYHKQMLLYTEHNEPTPKPLDYKPFGILKICFEDGTESVPLLDHSYGQSEMYETLRDKDNENDKQMIVELNEENYDKMIEEIKNFYHNLTYEKGYEGVVIKPEYVELGKLPMMKCRNTSYLTIIYGYDYMLNKLTRLIKKKTTSLKIKHSIREFEQGMELLKINYHEINVNDDYQKILMKILHTDDKGSTLDPRL